MRKKPAGIPFLEYFNRVALNDDNDNNAYLVRMFLR